MISPTERSLKAPIRLVTVTRASLIGRDGRAYADAQVLQHVARSALLVLCADSADCAESTMGGAPPLARGAVEVMIGPAFRFDAEISTRPDDPSAWIRALAPIAGSLIESWVHVSVDPEGDGVAARAAGAGVWPLFRPDRLPQIGAFIPPGDVPTLTDLWALTDQLTGISGPPVVYAVVAHCRDEETLARFVHWMRWEHGKDLLTVPGVTSFRILKVDAKTVRNEYLFIDQTSLDAYLAGPAAAMRAKGRERFSEAEARFEREILTHLGGYDRRAPKDFRAAKSGERPSKAANPRQGSGPSP